MSSVAKTALPSSHDLRRRSHDQTDGIATNHGCDDDDGIQSDFGSVATVMAVDALESGGDGAERLVRFMAPLRSVMAHA